MSNTRGLFWLLFLTVGFFVGPAFSQQVKVKSVNRIVIVDSRGKTVGESLGAVGIRVTEVGSGPTDLRPTVLIQVNQTVTPVNVARDRFYGGNLFFETLDCVGAAWFPAEPFGNWPAPLLPQSAVAPPGQSLFVETPNTQPQTINVRSMTGAGLACSNTSFSLRAVPAQLLVDLLTVFTPPFTLKAAP
ncbi:MAG: hypothetical protein HYX73_01835 [Acidobacteria bacterium]|nr:hypothetical protein [Acidobacteriota bacterium]